MELEANDRIGSLKGSLLDQSNDDGRVPVFGKGNIYDYTWFLDIPAGTRSGKIVAKSSVGLFKAGYDEEFTFALSEYGVPLPLKGTRGSMLVVQRMLPYDVVLFERLARISHRRYRKGLSPLV